MKCPVCVTDHRQKYYFSLNGYDTYSCNICRHIYVKDKKIQNLDCSMLYKESFL
jgi:hypothetical protein